MTRDKALWDERGFLWFAQALLVVDLFLIV